MLLVIDMVYIHQPCTTFLPGNNNNNNNNNNKNN
jgi:hypothetical protein